MAQEADRGRGGHDHPHAGRDRLDPLVVAEGGHVGSQQLVAGRQLGALLDITADAGVELEHLHLHGHDADQHETEHGDPGAPADEAVDQGSVGQRAHEGCGPRGERLLYRPWAAAQDGGRGQRDSPQRGPRTGWSGSVGTAGPTGRRGRAGARGGGAVVRADRTGDPPRGSGSAAAAQPARVRAVRWTAGALGRRLAGGRREGPGCHCCTSSLRAARRCADFDLGLDATSPGVGTMARRLNNSASGS